MKIQKNSEPLIQNSDAVTEVVGEILMTAIAVLAFSVISIFVFSYMDTTDKPHIDVEGWVDVDSDIVNLRHSGGEVIDSKDTKLILNLNGSRKEINSNDIGSIYGKNTWQLGDVISINTSSKWNKDIKEDDYVESTIVHTQSNVVIKNGMLLGSKYLSDSNQSIEPSHAYDLFIPTSVKDTSGGDVTINHIENIDDDKESIYVLSDGGNFNENSYQQFNFSPNLPNVPAQVKLLIIHKEEADTKNVKIKIRNQSGWYEKSSIEISKKYRLDEIDISNYIHFAGDINNLKIRYLSYVQGNNPNNKIANIDYIALNVTK